MSELVLSAAFQRQLKKSVKRNPELKNNLSEVFGLLIADVNHSSLRLHKLAGKNFWSVSVTDDLRIIIGLEGKRIFCLEIGSHDQVY